MSDQQISNLQVAQLRMFSVHDCAKKSFLAPMLFSTDLEAKRYIYDLISKNPDSLFSMFSDHYSLREIGTFDSSSGTGKFKLLPKETSFTQIIEELKRDGKK